MSPQRVAVLGAGILGTCLAITLARSGLRVLLVDEAPAPLAGASRWNEGKIHLGYLYGADATTATARRLLPDSLRFAPVVRELVGEDLGPHTSPRDDVYLVHERSVAAADSLAARFAAVDELVRDHPDAGCYLADARHARTRTLTAAELDEVAGEGIVAGFTVPERSVDTRWLADRFAEALVAEPLVEVRTGLRVATVVPRGGARALWDVRATTGEVETADVVVNALWHGRLAVDASAGVPLPRRWTHRYRRSLFVRTAGTDRALSAVVVVGPFGDLKDYGGGRHYLSWYPAGLAAETDTVEAPTVDPLDAAGEAALVAEVRRGLGTVVPEAAAVLDHAEEIVVGGGHVFAQGGGALDDPRSGLHRRDRFGVTTRGTYISVDTGKYSSAPSLAAALARDIVAS